MTSIAAVTEKPIKVLQFICPTGFYGAERWILALVRNLDTNVQCDLAVTLEDDSRNLELVGEYRRQDLGKAYELPMRYRFDIGVVTQLTELIQQQGIDVIHTHGYKSDIIGLWAARRAGIPCISTPHGFENARDLKLRLFIWLGCRAMARADSVAPLSPQLLDDCERLGVPKERVTYIQNGVDLTEVDEERKNPVKGKTHKQRIGFIGQLISRKNAADLLHVFDTLWQTGRPIELVLIGDGEERSALEAIATGLASHADIHFLGYREDRLALLHSFDLFVMSSTLEGIPRCLMEACAMGVPVVAYDIPGVDQLISHEKTGLLAPLGNKELLLEQWKRLLDDNELSQTLAEAARQHVNQSYSAARMGQEYHALFRQVLAREASA